MNNNWIIIYDNTSEARVLYVSESVTDSTGWEPEEMIGIEAYALFHPDDHVSLRKVHVYNVLNEKMSSMVSSYRFKCRDGNYVPVETLVHYCHDVIITCNFIYNVDSLDHKMRVNTVDEVYVCQPDGDLQLSNAWNTNQEKLLQQQQQQQQQQETLWVNSQVTKVQESRFCLILNRFTDDLTIVYASKLAQDLVSMDIKKSIGRSFFDFVPNCDLDTVRAQIDLAKEHDMVIRLRFDWLVNPSMRQPIEAVTSCTDDGLVMVLRLASG